MHTLYQVNFGAKRTQFWLMLMFWTYFGQNIIRFGVVREARVHIKSRPDSRWVPRILVCKHCYVAGNSLYNFISGLLISHYKNNARIHHLFVLTKSLTTLAMVTGFVTLHEKSKMPKMTNFARFWKPDACGQVLLPDR